MAASFCVVVVAVDEVVSILSHRLVCLPSIYLNNKVNEILINRDWTAATTRKGNSNVFLVLKDATSASMTVPVSLHSTG